MDNFILKINGVEIGIYQLSSNHQLKMVKKGKYKSRHIILGTVTLFTCEGKNGRG